MNKILHVAWRDFRATVFTKAFVIGALVPPLLMALAIPVAILLIKERPPAVKGVVTIIDHSGEGAGSADGLAAQRIAAALAPEALRAKLKGDIKEAKEKSAQMIEGMVGKQQAQQAKSMMETQMDSAVGEAPELTAEVLPHDADVKAAKDALLAAHEPQGGAQAPPHRLAVIVVHPDAVVRPAGDEDFGSY